MTKEEWFLFASHLQDEANELTKKMTPDQSAVTNGGLFSSITTLQALSSVCYKMAGEQT